MRKYCKKASIVRATEEELTKCMTDISAQIFQPHISECFFCIINKVYLTDYSSSSHSMMIMNHLIVSIFGNVD